MDVVFKQGRLLFAVAIAAFGVENLIWAHSTDPFLSVIPWVPNYPVLGYLTGVALLAASVSIAANLKPWLGATLLGAFFLLCDLFLQIVRVAAAPWDVGVRTCAFETLTMCASAWMLAAALMPEGGESSRWKMALHGLVHSGRYLFAVSMIVFGIDHYLVFNFIVSLVPHWIPGSGWLWTHVTAIGFIAAGVSIAARRLDRWAAGMLGLMFMLWFLVLHAPRVLSYPRCLDPDEWSSAFIALGVCGGAGFWRGRFPRSRGRRRLAEK
jgi:uncharacterized membrane protein